MNDYIKKLKRWYLHRNLREKILTIGMGWATIYALFSLLVFMPLDKKIADLNAAINEDNNQISNWNIQIDALKKIPNSPLYKQWLQDHIAFASKTNAYRSLLQSTSAINWDDIIKTILHADNNILIEQIKNSPEEKYSQTDAKIPIEIYQQRLLLVVKSNYFDTLGYLKRLQHILPTIHWESLNYAVETYPSATIQLEFLVLYEKTS